MAQLHDDKDIEPLDGVDRGDAVVLRDSDALNPDLEVGTSGEVVGFAAVGEVPNRQVFALVKIGRKTVPVAPVLLGTVT